MVPRAPTSPRRRSLCEIRLAGATHSVPRTDAPGSLFYLGPTDKLRSPSVRGGSPQETKRGALAIYSDKYGVWLPAR